MIGHIYMIFFIAFIGFVAGIFTAASVLHSNGELKPDALDEVLIILGEAYDTSQIPPDAYCEMRERIMAMKETSHIKTMDLLQEVSIKRGRREALEEVLGILDELQDDFPLVVDEIADAVKKLMEGENGAD